MAGLAMHVSIPVCTDIRTHLAVTPVSVTQAGWGPAVTWSALSMGWYVGIVCKEDDNDDDSGGDDDIDRSGRHQLPCGMLFPWTGM